MSVQCERRDNCTRKLFKVASASALATILSGQVQESRADVFEQACNGEVVVLGSGARLRAPLQQFPAGGGERATPTSIIEFDPPVEVDVTDVPVGATMAVDAPPPPPSICATPPAGTTSRGLVAIKTIQSGLSLPTPRQLPQTFNDDQLEMRELTEKIGSQFADAPGVRKANLDEPAFVKLFTTLVHRESNFKAKAVSPVGARGLGQLMPATARHLGVKDTFAPEQNLAGAATYLTDMLDQFGSPELALAAYNAGPGAVTKYGGIPPYRETRQYVADIFHEVLREPVSGGTEENISDVARRGLAAFSSEPGPASVDKTPFDTVLADKTQPDTHGVEYVRVAYADTVATGAIGNVSFKLPAKRDAALHRNAALEADKIPEMLTSAAVVPTAALPSPDLSTLPKPREFSGNLVKSQRAMRKLAVDIALRHAKAPGVKKAELSEEAFVALFVALIRRESSFNSGAVSPDGAKGLGQLMPETVRALGLKDPFVAEANLDVSAARLAQLLDKFGNTALALAAYNAGEHAIVDRTVIPQTRETKQFVADVLYDLKSAPRPDFVVARLEKAAAAAEMPAVPKLEVSSAGHDVVRKYSTSPAPVLAGSASQTSVQTDVSFVTSILSALDWALGQFTVAFQSILDADPSDGVLLASPWGQLWSYPAWSGSDADALAVPEPSSKSRDEELVTLPGGKVLAVGAAASPVLDAKMKPDGNRIQKNSKPGGDEIRRNFI
jgi:soluble lytic murein transglycosylase-like protein